MVGFRNAFVIIFALVCALCAFGQTAVVMPPAASTGTVTNPNAYGAELQSVTIPMYTLFGFSFDPLGAQRFKGFISALEPESQDPKSILYNTMLSETLDITPIPYTDPVTKRAGVLMSGSLRFGQHRLLINTSRDPVGCAADGTGCTSPFKPGIMLSVGGDLGAQFASGASTATSASAASSSFAVGLSGSLTAGLFYRFTRHWGCGIAARAVRFAAIDPNTAPLWKVMPEPSCGYAK